MATGNGLTEGVARSRASYASARLVQRRSVRVALALSHGLKHGPRAARELLSSGADELDLPGPPLPMRSRYPQLRIGHLSPVPVTEGVVPGTRLQPDRWRTIIRRDRPDLVLLDDLAGWDGSGLRELVANLTVPVFTWSSLEAQLRDSGIDPRRLLRLPGGVSAHRVDSQESSPVGLPPQPSGEVRTLDVSQYPESGSSPNAGASPGRDDVLVIRDNDSARIDQMIAWLARGAVTVAPRDERFAALLGPVADTLLAPGRDLDELAHDLTEPSRWERTSVRARRYVHVHRSREAFVDRLLETCGFNVTASPRISVLLCTRRQYHLEHALQQIGRQEHADIEVILGLHGIDLPDDRVLERAGRPTRVVRVPRDRPLGVVLNAALHEASGTLIAKMDDDDHYGANHLSDLLVALQYSQADVVGRWSNAVYLEKEDRTVHTGLEHQERWATHLPGATMLARGDVLRRLGWRNVPNAVDTELVRSIISDGGLVYSTHRFGFIRHRHGDHTFARTDRGFRGAQATPGLARDVLDV